MPPVNYVLQTGAGPAVWQLVSTFVSTYQLVSGTGKQFDITRAVFVHTPVTFTPTAALTATCKVEISPDNVTYTALCTWLVPALATLAGMVKDVYVPVPAGWYLRLTATRCTLGLSTLY